MYKHIDEYNLQILYWQTPLTEVEDHFKTAAFISSQQLYSLQPVNESIDL